MTSGDGSGATMHFGLLGPLSVRDGDADFRISGSKLRTLLVVLLLNANDTVPFHVLRTALWGEDPPASADASLRNQVTRLRRALGDDDGKLLRSVPGGYVLDVADDALDTRVFERRLRRARAALLSQDWESLSRETAEALALWRGTPLTDMAETEQAGSLGRQLQQDRLQALEWHFEAELALGRPEGLVRELTRLADDHPLHEAFHRQLMLALHRTGQRAQALAVFQRLRRRLVDDLGIEPGTAARQAHEAILRTDGGSTRQPAAAPPPPNQLPSTIGHFTGRAETLRALDGLVRPEGADGQPLIAIVGSAGNGKTALAVHWGHRIARRFPDGCLYANLQGFDPAPGPVAPEHIVRGFLQALGISHGQLPSTVADQIGLYRSLLAGRRILVVLDNARDSQQVRPLLPGDSTCLTIVTSRDQLTGLVAVDGAQPVRLGLMDPEEAADLLARRLGAEHARSAPGALQDLAELCGRLPLALNIAAARLATAPPFQLDAFVRNLRKADDSLLMFDTGDPAATLRTVFSWSYQKLSAPAARLFRVLGVHPGPDLGVPVCAAVMDLPPAAATAFLNELTGLHLLEQRHMGRYVLHDLLRTFARELGRTVDGEAAVHDAEGLMLDHYLHSAFAADRAVQPSRVPIELVPAHPAAAPVTFANPAEAMKWYETEIAVLLFSAARAAASGRDMHAWQVPWALTTYLYRAGRWPDLTDALLGALSAVERLGDLPGQTRIHTDLGQALDSLRAFDQAHAHYQAALDLSIESGNVNEQARAQYSLGTHEAGRDQYADAIGHMLRAAELYRESGNATGLAVALNGVAWCNAKQNNYTEAVAYANESLAGHRAVGERAAEANTLDTLAFIHHSLGDTAQATDYYRQAAAVYTELGERGLHALTMLHVGDLYAETGAAEAARQIWTESLATLTTLNHPSVEEVRERLRSTEIGGPGHAGA